MQPFRRRSSGTACTVIELGAAHLAVAQVRRETSGRLRVEALALRSFLATDPPGGEVDIPEGLPAAWTGIEAELALSGQATLVIPGHLTLSKGLRVPPVAAAQREKIIAFEAQQAIPFPLAEVVWDYQLLQDGGPDAAILITAAKTEAVTACVRQITGRGLEPQAVRPAAFALVAAYRRTVLAAAVPDEPVLLLGLGARSTHLIFIAGETFHLRTLTLAGNTVTRAIAETLGQSFAEAEHLKLQVLEQGVQLPADSPAGAAVQEAADAFVARLRLEISRSLVTHKRQQGGGEPRRLLLAGGGAGLPGLAETLATTLNRPVERLDPWVDLDAAPAATAASAQPGRWRFAELIGAAALALRPTEFGDAKVTDLLPPEFGWAQAVRRRRPRWLAAAVMLALAIALPGWHEWRLARARERAAAELVRNLAAPHALQIRNQQALEQLARLQREIATLTELVGAQSAWSSFLADLQSRMIAVEDVWLERLQVLPPVAAPARTGRTLRTAADGPNADGPPVPPLRLRISGRLLDRENPLSRVSASSYERATALLSRFVESPFVSALEGERFDAGDPGILRFDFTLVINPSAHL